MMPELDKLIKSLECEEWDEVICKRCPYGYGHLDQSGDYWFWTCDEEKRYEHILFYLKLYQYLIEENEK